jgi:hypothetical protein
MADCAWTVSDLVKLGVFASKPQFYPPRNCSKVFTPPCAHNNLRRYTKHRTAILYASFHITRRVVI